MRLHVATPHAGNLIHAAAADSIAEFMCDCVRAGHAVTRTRQEDVFVHAARCALVDAALRREVDGILFWDADTFCTNTGKLLALLEHPVATAAVRSRHHEGEYAIYNDLEHDGRLCPLGGANLADGPFEVDAAGAALLWVRCDVMQTLKAQHLWPPFCVEQGADGKLTAGEDIFFSRLVREAGFRIICDPRIATGHIGSRVLVHAPRTEE